MPSNASAGPAIDQVDPHRHAPDDGAEHDRTPARRIPPEQPPEDEGDGDDQVGPEGQRQSGQHAGDEPASPPSAISSRWSPRTANTALHRVSASAPFQAMAVSAIGVMHVEDGERGNGGGGHPTPRPGQCEQPEDDAEVLQQAERALGRQRVAEHAVPAHQRVQRPRAVEVEEVDVGHVAVAHQLGEVEHEALFHRPAREAVEAPQRDGHQHQDRRRRRPRCPRPRQPGAAARPSPRARRRYGRRERSSPGAAQPPR